MPVPTPHKGEKEDDFMERCMHEVSSNPDRTNDQNVAICKDAWRKGPQKEETNSKMNTFKTLAEARGAYETLAAQLAEMQQKTTNIEQLKLELNEAKVQRADILTENESFKAQIEQKEAEIGALNTENVTLKSEILGLKDAISLLEKGQKSAKIHARELVAASGGAPIAVDQAEISRMQSASEREMVAEMAKENNPARLNQLYQEYNRIFRPNSKHKK